MIPRFMTRHPRLTALLFGLGLSGLMLLMAEVGLRVLSHYRPVVPDSDTRFDIPTPTHRFERDSSGSKRPPAGVAYRARATIRKTGELLYDVTYKIDDRRRRITPVDAGPARDKHALFFADSFAYGEGVQENETLEYYVGTLAREYMPYNYGFHAGSPLEMLAKLESNELPLEVPEKNGFLVYLFIDGHVGRTIGTMRYSMWDLHRPYFRVLNDGRVVRDGDLSSGRPWLTTLYSILGRSKILEYLNVDFPPRVTDKHVQYVARLLQEARRLYLRQFPGSEFYVLLYPGSRRLGLELLSHLQEMGIACLDYTDLIPEDDREAYQLPVDRHPNARAYQFLARRLVADLNLVHDLYPTDNGREGG